MSRCPSTPLSPRYRPLGPTQATSTRDVATFLIAPRPHPALDTLKVLFPLFSRYYSYLLSRPAKNGKRRNDDETGEMSMFNACAGVIVITPTGTTHVSTSRIQPGYNPAG